MARDPPRGAVMARRAVDRCPWAVEAVSLSVETNNYARRLCERVGFRTVGAHGGSLTMLLRL